MGRRAIEDRAKSKGSTKTSTPGMVGSRRADTGEVAEDAGSGDAMDAVREVVQSEGIGDTNKEQGKGAGDKAMDAIREVVEKE